MRAEALQPGDLRRRTGVYYEPVRLRPPTMQEVLRQYIEIIKKVQLDLDRPVRHNIYAIDFSELHVYLHRWRHRPLDFVVMDYITQNIHQPQDRISLLPPTVIEFLDYLQKLQFSLSRYKDYGRLLQDERIDSFIKQAERLERGAEPKEVLKLHDAMQADFAIRRFASGLGAPLLIRDPVQRFVAMIDAQRIQPVQKILGTSDVPINRRTYETLRQELQDKRPYLPRNNIIDALCGGMVFGICDEKYKSNQIYSNFVTQSRRPLEVMEKIPWQNDPLKMPLVRTTLYLLGRTICQDILSEDPDKIEALNRSIATLENLARFRNENDMYKFVSESMSERYHGTPSEFRATELNHLQFFVRAFYYDSNWDEIYRKAKVKILENSIARRDLLDALERRDKERLESLGAGSYDQIKSVSRAISELKGYDNALRASQEELRETMTHLYLKLKKFLDGVDLSLASPDAEALIERIEAGE